MSIKIIKAGMMTSLQGAPRVGFRSNGIGLGGAMDFFARETANYLVGNAEDRAAMEINFPAPEIIFLQPAVISITGADFKAYINGYKIPTWTPVYVKRDSILQFREPANGTKAYLAVQGGWEAEKWLGSSSTHLKAAAGGYSGRVLQRDDCIGFPPCLFSFDQIKIFPWKISPLELAKIYQPSDLIRCIKAIEWDLMDVASTMIFEKSRFSIHGQSDRMGYLLNGEKMVLKHPLELISSATDAGTIQLLPSGNMVVLMADHQTTGGYPRIGAVIKADLPKLAQLATSKSVNFIIVDQETAEKSLLQLKMRMNIIKNSCCFTIEKYLRDGH